MGLRLDQLGTDALTWRDLWVIIHHLPPTSATVMAVAGPPSPWGLTEHLLAAAVDTLRGANWQRGGGKGSRPEPIKRPGTEAERAEKHFGSKPLPVDEMHEWLGWGR